jgi:hypothetical protein
MAEFEGQTIGSWQIKRYLGGGERGEMYLAEQMGAEAQAAIRIAELAVPPALLAAGKSPAAVFSQEAQRLVSLKHAYVLSLLEYGQQNQRGYLVMPYLSDGSLLDAFTPGKSTFRFALPLSAPTVVGLLDQVAGALQYLHEQGILHGSVKPSNMLLSPDASGGLHILLSDFGLASLFVSTPSRMTRHHSVLYSAPELLQGRPVPASDQYSLGIVVYELLTGRLPFVGNDPAQVIQQQLLIPPPPPRNYTPNIPPAVEQVLFRALSKDPSSRWPSVAAFAAAYRQAAAGQANVPQPQSQPVALPQQAPAAPVQQFPPASAAQPFSAVPVAPSALAVAPAVAPPAQAPWPGAAPAAPASPVVPQAGGGRGWNQAPGGWGNQYPANQPNRYQAYPAAQPPAPIVPNTPLAPARWRGRLVGLGIGGVVALVLAVVLVVVLVGGNKGASTANGGKPTTPPGATATTPGATPGVPSTATPGDQGTPSDGSTPGGSDGSQMIQTDQIITAVATVTNVSGDRQCNNQFPGSSKAEFQVGDTVLVVYTANLTQNQLQILVTVDKVDPTTGASLLTVPFMPPTPQPCAGKHNYVVAFATDGDQKGPGTYKAEISCLACGNFADATIFFEVR